MHDFPFFTRLYYRYLSLAFWFAFFTRNQKVLWVPIERWLKMLVIGLLVSALIFQWGEMVVGITAVTLVWLYFSYWRAKKMGYSKFVANSKMTLPTGELTRLPFNHKVHTKATGIFSVRDVDDFVLLKPATYWQVPLGEHVMMVQVADRLGYRYQFFNPHTLQRIQKGWLLFGSQPRRSLAITLLSEFGETYANQLNQFSFGKEIKTKGVLRTVYLSFDDEAEETLVWHNVVLSARDARQESGA